MHKAAERLASQLAEEYNLNVRFYNTVEHVEVSSGPDLEYDAFYIVFEEPFFRNRQLGVTPIATAIMDDKNEETTTVVHTVQPAMIVLDAADQV